LEMMPTGEGKTRTTVGKTLHGRVRRLIEERACD
jgi:hypothetical protein